MPDNRGAGIIAAMADFSFFKPIDVRYADLDPQGHVNNATYLSYLEHGRVGYMQRLGLWDGRSFLDTGVILAEARITYRAPVLLGQMVEVGVRVAKMGSRSIEMEYLLRDCNDGRTLAQATTVLVTYDYRAGRTVRIPEEWRAAIRNFEGLDK